MGGNFICKKTEVKIGSTMNPYYNIIPDSYASFTNPTWLFNDLLCQLYFKMG